MPIWKEFEIETENIKLKEIGVENCKMRRALVDIERVESFYESDKDGTDEEVTVLCFKSGDSLTVFKKYDLIKELINQ